MFCREAVASLSGVRADIEARGGRLVFVGNGTALMARDFAEQFGVDAPLFTDPSRKAFKAAGMKRRMGLSWQSLAMGKRALAAGHTQGRTKGDPFQQGGVLVLDGEGAELHRQNADDAGTEILLEPILRALGPAPA